MAFQPAIAAAGGGLALPGVGRQAEAGDHLAQLLAGSDVAQADILEMAEIEQSEGRSGNNSR